MENNKEILIKIEDIQYAIDQLVKTNTVKFNTENDIKILEGIYYDITGRKYVKFNSGCGSCIREALLIANNFKKREEKKIQEVIDELKEEIKPSPRAKAVKKGVKKDGK